MNLKIERGIPIPEATTRSGGNMELLRSMEVGDSVLFAGEDVKKATRFYRVAKKLGVSIVIRKDGKGMRMWRVTTPIEEMATPKKADPKAVAKKANAALKAQRKASPDGMLPSERAMATVKARVPARVSVEGNGAVKHGKSPEQKAKDAAAAKARRAAKAQPAV